jgi:hypothetical protein
VLTGPLGTESPVADVTYGYSDESPLSKSSGYYLSPKGLGPEEDCAGKTY